jgi:hypothetical protein
MDSEPLPTKSTSYVPPVVDEARDFDIGPLDIILGVLTLPLLLFAIQYAVSGSEKLLATPQARLKVYGVLLVLEAIILAVIFAFVLR